VPLWDAWSTETKKDVLNAPDKREYVAAAKLLTTSPGLAMVVESNAALHSLYGLVAGTGKQEAIDYWRDTAINRKNSLDKAFAEHRQPGQEDLDAYQHAIERFKGLTADSADSKIRNEQLDQMTSVAWLAASKKRSSGGGVSSAPAATAPRVNDSLGL